MRLQMLPPLDFTDAPLFGRNEGLRFSLELLHERRKEQDPRIIEIGTSRTLQEGSRESDGYATVAFGWYLQTYGGRLWTIDISKKAIENCKILTRDYRDVIRYIHNESTCALEENDQGIDMLYLDGANDPAQNLVECEKAFPYLGEHAVVLMDDTSLKRYKSRGGICKGALAYKFLFDRGWRIVYDHKNQVVMTKSANSPNTFAQKLLSAIKTKILYRRFHRKERERVYRRLLSP